MADYKYKEITEKIIGSSMKVHSTLGNGFQEVIYQRALEIEMLDAGLHFSREFNILFIIRDGKLVRDGSASLSKKK
jgi:GxxExxY protein